MSAIEQAAGRLRAMREHCREQQRIQGQADAFVTFRLPGRFGSRKRARLFGKHGGPYGDILADDFARPGFIVVGFKADEVIAFLERKLAELGEAALEHDAVTRREP